MFELGLFRRNEYILNEITILLNHQMEISMGYLGDIKPVKRYLNHKSIMEKMIHFGMGTK